MTDKRRLTDMSLEELWQLFPISLVPHRKEWCVWAKDEIARLTDLLSEFTPVISHIGSTAIEGIYAKPIVDILVELPGGTRMDGVGHLMDRAGYINMSKSESRMSYNKGYTPDGYAERVFHIHFHYAGDRDEIVFRDYLCRNPSAAREYEQLKQSLLPRYKYDRDGYTAAKTDFVKNIIKKAKNEH